MPKTNHRVGKLKTHLIMGMPKTKADCDMEIASLKSQIAGLRAKIPAYRSKDMKDAARREIASLQGKIARLQAHKKTLK